MADPVDGSITHVFGQMRRGNQNAAGKLLNQFFPRLVGLARKTLDGNPRQVADEQDAAQSAFASFWQRPERGDLAAICTAMKSGNCFPQPSPFVRLLKQIEREKAQKTGRRPGTC